MVLLKGRWWATQAVLAKPTLLQRVRVAHGRPHRARPARAADGAANRCLGHLWVQHARRQRPTRAHDRPRPARAPLSLQDYRGEDEERDGDEDEFNGCKTHPSHRTNERAQRQCPFANWHTIVALSYRSTVRYTRRPERYDLEYSFKDYESECAHIEEIVRARAPGARTLLDVACGTGKHLAFLRTRFTCEGVDLDSGLLRVARERLGDVPLHEGDMRSLSLGRRFDVVTCLFSAIGFALDLDGLAATAQSLTSHVADGGVLIVEPWLTPDVWRPGRPHVLAADDNGIALARVTLAGQRGRISTTEMHYTVGTPDGIEQWHEHHELGLFTVEEMRIALEATGLAVEHDPAGLMGRGLWIATR